MREFFNYDGKLMQFLNKVADMMIISVLWFFLSITVIGFGPACVASYHAMTKAVRYGRGHAFKEFFSALKSGFWKGLVYGLLIMAFAASVLVVDLPPNVDYLFYGGTMNVGKFLVLIVKVVLLMTISLYVFPIISRFEMPFMQIFGASCLLSVRHIISTVLMAGLLALSFVAVFSLPYLVLLIPGVFSYLQGYYMEKIMRAHMSEEDMEIREDEDQWYLV